MSESKPPNGNGMTDAELARLERDLTDKLQLITELTNEAQEMYLRYQAELAFRRTQPGTVREFRPRPANGEPPEGE